MPERMYAGMVVSYKVAAVPGIKVSWITEITHVREPEYFVDEQRFGPYRFWHHQHHFKTVAGGVEMADHVSYLLPFYPMGLMAAPLVSRRLEYIFNYRRRILENIFKGRELPFCQTVSSNGAKDGVL